MKNITAINLSLLVVLIGFGACSDPARTKTDIDYSGLYQNLEFGTHAVGFKIIKIYDETRYVINDRNIFGEKVEGDRHRPVYIHLWYPAVSTGNHLTMGEYATFSESSSDNLNYTDDEYDNATNRHKFRIANFFGQVPDSMWAQLIEEPIVAQRNPEMKDERFPLLIGQLRPFSTDITNEYLASHGYVVAHVRKTSNTSGIETPNAAARDIISDYRDLEIAIAYLKEGNMVDQDMVGTFGFSGSGFMQVHLAMMNPDIDAIADLESGYFMEGLWDWLTVSPTFEPANLQVPFLHIFSDTLSREEIMLDKFRNINYSDRYRLILNEPPHHWDFATEGFLAAGYLSMRGEIAESVVESFKISNIYLKEFFDAFVKNEPAAQQFMRNALTENGFDEALVEMEHIPVVYQTPGLDELVFLIEQENVKEVKQFTIESLKSDTASGLKKQISGLNWLARKYSRALDVERTIAVAEIMHAADPESDTALSPLDDLGYRFLNDGDHEMAIRIFKKNVELNADHHLPYYGLGDAYARSGRKDEALAAFEKGLELAHKAEDYPENLLNAHKRAYENQINQLKNNESKIDE